MTDSPLEIALSKLTEIQRTAVDWNDGALLVLAGPGSGKTQILTCRIARLLDSAPEKNFRVLALTFTNKAADEMKARVATFVPNLEHRVNIGTFHSFCSQVLRQHGAHIDIQPNFSIYSLDDDRRAILEDALRNARSNENVGLEDVRYLSIIDRLKANLVGPESSEKALSRFPDSNRIALVYRLYELELRRLNALDFNSLIFETYRLARTYPAIASRYTRSHPFWLVDEFQDTNSAQYRLLRALSGSAFKNIFCVADDDQIIYQWNGATYKNIQSFLSDYAAELIQLPTNYRCPPIVVQAANSLVSYNAQRTASKNPLIAGKTDLKFSESDQLQLRHFPSDGEEAEGIASEIFNLGSSQWSETAVLARNRTLLEKMHSALQNATVPSVIAQRRDNFLSSQFRWLVSYLTQSLRPLDRRNFSLFVESFNRMTGIDLQADQLLADAEATGESYFSIWFKSALLALPDSKYLSLLESLDKPSTSIDGLVTNLQNLTSDSDDHSDFDEDLKAWKELSRGIAQHIGKNAPLDQFLQELQLRSKEPSPKPNTVALMTVHGAKGREFDNVFVIGMAEDVLPSYQSRQKGDNSPEMEEERRNCFVAITRTKERLILSRADRYRGWIKPPSRFLVEMGLVKDN